MATQTASKYNYVLGEKLHTGKYTDVFRARLEPSGEAVIVKTSRNARMELSEAAKLRQEFEFGRELGAKIAVEPLALQEDSGKIALILRDFGGVSLKQLAGSRPLAVPAFLDIARTLADHLAGIHSAGIIHKDIKPANILIHRTTRTIRFIDFGISSRVNLKRHHLGNPDVLEGSLAYMSPEQTGRMNRIVDYRSDLYSLGATFYEMLTGRPPFEARSSIEIVHSHIARVPPSPHEINENVPRILSDIVMRLLAKNAEERYQSAFGLKHDLDECQRHMETGILTKDDAPREIPSFALGSRDFSGVFQISQKLYGREANLATLMETFDRVAGGSVEMMLVSGYSGVGKSALVNEVHKPITARRGNFISGKYDQFQRNIPYSAIRQAFDKFAHLLLTEDESSFARWRERILEAVGGKGQVLIDVIPGLEQVLGKQPAVPHLSPQEAQVRFNTLFQNFTRAISRAEHPLVLFIDDLQWADSASLALIQTLLTDKSNAHFLFVGAYRDNEVDPAHPFLLAVEDLKQAGAVVHDIVLDNLTPEDLGRLVSDALHASPERVRDLVKLVHARTKGNAFFTTQLLKDLYENDHLRFDFSAQRWIWDAGRIAGLDLTDDVVLLMTQKLGRLESATREVVRLASCMGSDFDLFLLSIIHQHEQTRTMEDLWPAVQENLLLPVNDHYRIVLETETRTKVNGGSDFATGSDTVARFRFAHDRIQQAAYALIPDSDRQAIHLQIGRLLLKHSSAADLDDRVFAIVYQLNRGLSLITDPEEKRRTAELNLLAGEKASNSSAFGAALSYVNAALQLLDDAAWETHHDLAFGVYRLKAASEWSSYRLEDCARTIETVLPRCKTEDEKVAIYMIQLSNLFGLNRHWDGVRVAHEALRYLGVKLPKNPGKHHIALEYARFRLELGRRRPADIVHIPEIQDNHQLNICKILYNSVESAYMVAPDTMGLVSVMMARICLRYGNSIYSPVAYAMVSLVVEGVLKQFDFAWEFSELAEKLNEAYPNLDAKARTFFLNGNFPLHWVKPVEEHEAYIRTALQCAIDAGNVHWGNYSIAFSRAQSLFFNRSTLAEIEAENAKFYEFHARSKDREVTLNMYMLLKYVNDLRGTPVEVENVFDYDPEVHHDEMHTPGNFLMREYFFTLRLMEHYDRQEFDAAMEWGWKGFAIVLEVLGVLLDYQQRFYYQLAYLAPRSRPGLWKRIKYALGFRVNRFMLKLYVKSIPENFRAHQTLLEAEESRVNGRLGLSARLYDRAIAEAEASRFPLIIALANELAGRHHLTRSGRTAAGPYLRAALQAYRNWGAGARVERFRARYELDS